jgi:hypothetical protein
MSDSFRTRCLIFRAGLNNSIASFTGETIEMGQTLAKIYSLRGHYSAAELLEAAKKSRNPACNL